MIALTHGALQALGDPHQHLITDRMAKTVVDNLEPIQVNEQQGRTTGAGAAQAGDTGDQHLIQLLPVEQPGQGVMSGGILQSQSDPLALADICLRTGQTPMAQRIGFNYAANQYPEKIAIASPDAVLMVQPGHSPADMGIQ